MSPESGSSVLKPRDAYEMGASDAKPDGDFDRRPDSELKGMSGREAYNAGFVDAGGVDPRSKGNDRPANPGPEPTPGAPTVPEDEKTPNAQSVTPEDPTGGMPFHKDPNTGAWLPGEGNINVNNNTVNPTINVNPNISGRDQVVGNGSIGASPEYEDYLRRYPAFQGLEGEKTRPQSFEEWQKREGSSSKTPESGTATNPEIAELISLVKEMIVLQKQQMELMNKLLEEKVGKPAEAATEEAATVAEELPPAETPGGVPGEVVDTPEGVPPIEPAPGETPEEHRSRWQRIKNRIRSPFVWAPIVYHRWMTGEPLRGQEDPDLSAEEREKQRRKRRNWRVLGILGIFGAGVLTGFLLDDDGSVKETIVDNGDNGNDGSVVDGEYTNPDPGNLGQDVEFTNDSQGSRISAVELPEGWDQKEVNGREVIYDHTGKEVLSADMFDVKAEDGSVIKEGSLYDQQGNLSQDARAKLRELNLELHQNKLEYVKPDGEIGSRFMTDVEYQR